MEKTEDLFQQLFISDFNLKKFFFKVKAENEERKNKNIKKKFFLNN